MILFMWKLNALGARRCGFHFGLFRFCTLTQNILSGIQLLYDIHIDEVTMELSASVKTRYHLPKSKRRLLVHAVPMTTEDGDFLICADMVGSLHIYKMEV